MLASLRERIRRDGPMPLDEYMRLCQADPEHGYWQRAGSIGAGGDFITAPEISQVFGELIGLWCAVFWQGMGRPVPLRLIELAEHGCGAALGVGCGSGSGGVDHNPDQADQDGRERGH